MNTKAYRELIRIAIQTAAHRAKDAHILMSELPADAGTLHRVSEAMRQAQISVDRVIGMIVANRALNEREDN